MSTPSALILFWNDEQAWREQNIRRHEANDERELALSKRARHAKRELDLDMLRRSYNQTPPPRPQRRRAR